MKILIYIPILISPILLFTTCKEPIIDFSDYDPFPITLRVEKISEKAYKYSWNPIQTSDFKKYVIVRSIGDSIPFFNQTGKISDVNPSFSIVTTVNESKVTEFIDSLNPIAGKNYIKIFALLEDRALSSINLSIQGDTTLTEIIGASDDVVLSTKSNVLVSADVASQSINFFDLSKNKQITRNPTSIGSQTRLALFDTPNGEELFCPTTNFFTQTINMSSGFFTSIRTVFSFRNNTFITHPNNNWILSSDNFGITSRPRSNYDTGLAGNDINFNLTITDFSIIQPPLFLIKQYSSKNFLAVKNLNDKLEIHFFNFAQNGNFILSGSKSIAVKSLTNGRPIIITPDDKYYIADENGTVYQMETVIQKTILAEQVPTGNAIKYIDFQFSNDGKTIYALRKPSRNVSERLIDIFNYPECEFQRSVGYKSTPSRIFVYNNNLLVVGTSPNEVSHSIFEKVKL